MLDISASTAEDMIAEDSKTPKPSEDSVDTLEDTLDSDESRGSDP